MLKIEYRVFQDQLVIARKAHRCDNCAAVIAKGETYERVMCWADAHVTIRYCVKCHQPDQLMHWSDSISNPAACSM